MRRTHALAVLLLAACRSRSDDRAAVADALAGILPGEEREIGKGVFMTMHRIQATSPLGDGWNLARSTEGGFSVELPLPFNDFRIRAETTDHVALRTHSVGAKTAAPGLLAWSASCVVRRDGKLGPEGRPPGRDETETKGTKAVQRTVELEGIACVLVVEAQGTEPLPPRAESERFLRSLKITGKPTW